MSHRSLPFAFALLAWTALLHAEDPKPQLEPPPAYDLKNRSTFTTSTTSPRPPFWPIGWVHRDASSPLVQAQAPVKIAVDETLFKVTSILLGSGTTQSLAIINGRPYSEGESIRLPRPPGSPPGSPAVRVRILRIDDGSVLLQHGEQKLVAPLRREEVARHADEKLLDSADRDDQDPAPAPAVGKATVPNRPAPTPQRVARP